MISNLSYAEGLLDLGILLRGNFNDTIRRQEADRFVKAILALQVSIVSNEWLSCSSLIAEAEEDSNDDDVDVSMAIPLISREIQRSFIAIASPAHCHALELERTFPCPK